MSGEGLECRVIFGGRPVGEGEIEGDHRMPESIPQRAQYAHSFFVVEAAISKCLGEDSTVAVELAFLCLAA